MDLAVLVLRALRTVLAVTPGEWLGIIVGSGGAAGAGGDYIGGHAGFVDPRLGGWRSGCNDQRRRRRSDDQPGRSRASRARRNRRSARRDVLVRPSGRTTTGRPVRTSWVVGGSPIQGSVATLASASAGGSGSNSGVAVQAGANGELILSW